MPSSLGSPARPGSVEGEGLNGRAWHRRELVHVDDIGELTDCCRAPIARRSGVRAAVCLPILRGGVVIGTMDFFATQALDITRDRLDALRAIARLASDKITKPRRPARDGPVRPG